MATKRPRARTRASFSPAPSPTPAELKDSRSVVGTPAAAMPAFVLGQELSDLADRDARIVVLTADLASANRTVEFKARHPERFFDLGIAEKNMITTAAGMASCGHDPLRRDLRLLLRAARRRADPHRLRLSAHAGAHHRPSFRHLDGLLRHQPPCAGGSGDDAHHRRPDGGLRVRRQPAARRPARLGRSSGRDVYPPRPRPRSRRSIRRCRPTSPSARRRACARAATSPSSPPVRRCAPASTPPRCWPEEGIEARVVDMHTIKPLDAAEVRAAACRDRRDPDGRGAQRHRRPRQRGRGGAGRARPHPVPPPRHPGRVRAGRAARRALRALQARCRRHRRDARELLGRS